MAILGSIAKTVTFIFTSSKSLNEFILKPLFKDDSCWNDPCEGCVPLGLNSQEFKCTCLSKSFDSTCQLGSLI